MKVLTTLCLLFCVLAVVADAKRLGSTSVEEFDDGAITVRAGAPLEFDAPELEVYDRLLDAPKVRHGDNENFRLLEGNNIFGEEDIDGRDLATQSCLNNQQKWFFELTTDNYAFESSWELKRNNQVMIAGPPSGTRYQDGTYYSGSTCLDENSYTLVMKDSQGDGLCCSFGNGNYKSTIDGKEIGSSPGNSNFEIRRHNFVVQGGGGGGGGGGGNGSGGGGGSGSGGGTGRSCMDVTITLQVDEWEYETSYELARIRNGNGIGEAVDLDDPVMFSHNNNDAHERKNQTACVPPGHYRFTITDEWGGIYENSSNGQRNGFYKIEMNNEVVINGDRFTSKKETHNIRVGYVPNMGDRDNLWLYAHNIGSDNFRRRRDWHEDNGKLYVPLKWSTFLAADAKAWAETLVENCNTPWHAPGINHGENLAGNDGTGSWGNQPVPDLVLKRWVDNEANVGWPGNAHLTQALWRATKYVGCGEASRDMGNGRTCHRQVCRYVKAGNCAIGSGENWKGLLLQDESRCGPVCPREGCY